MYFLKIILQILGTPFANFLAIDFEKNPSSAEFNYDVSVRLEAFEVTYHSVIHLIYRYCF